MTRVLDRKTNTVLSEVPGLFALVHNKITTLLEMLN